MRKLSNCWQFVVLFACLIERSILNLSQMINKSRWQSIDDKTVRVRGGQAEKLYVWERREQRPRLTIKIKERRTGCANYPSKACLSCIPNLH
ncbi:hypothetical protein T02_11010 [Trichinella nativa]|uniref:Secreted protein n=1 Tax=Trichinella nativa TaxID=6335 RepID=A0A0V1LAX4_9BILA|nr:hypothetical protein T02_11010 [Trichinella nativa]